MTGKYPHQIGMWNHQCKLPVEERTIGNHLGEHGYDVAAFGKTHEMNRGFRSYTYDRSLSMETKFHGYSVVAEDITGVFAKGKEHYCDFIAVRQFDEYLSGDEREGKPFAAYIGIYAPHPPLFPPEPYANLYDPLQLELPDVQEDEDGKPDIQHITRERWKIHTEQQQRNIVARYLGMVTMLDDCVGLVLESLRKNGLLEQTVLVFTSDHGDQLGEHDMIGKFNTLYEGAIRVPLLFRLPNREHAGQEIGALAEMIDIYPTLCSFLDVAPPQKPYEWSGRSLAEALDDPDYFHRDEVHSMMEHAQMVRTEEWKLVYHLNDRSELYNLRNDPGENDNLYEVPQYMEIRDALKSKILDHLLRQKRSVFHRGSNAYFG
jgi:arylsulfatase A-like enzyme